MNQLNAYYETWNLAEAAYLTCVGNRLQSHRMEGKRMVFQFLDTDTVHADARNFIYGGKVEAMKYFDAVKQIKSVLWMEKDKI